MLLHRELFFRYLDTWPVRGVPSPDLRATCELPVHHRRSQHQVLADEELGPPAAALAQLTEPPYPSLKPQCCFHRVSSRRRRSPPPPPVRRTPGSLAEHHPGIIPGDYLEGDIFREGDIALGESPTSSTPPPSPPPPPSFASRRGLLQRKEFGGGLDAVLRHPPCSATRAPKRWRLMLSLSQSTPDEEEVEGDDNEDEEEEEEEEETGTDPSDEGGFVSNGVSVLRGNPRPMLR